MSLFQDQLKNREISDDNLVSEAIDRISGAITGKRISAFEHNERLRSLDAINQVLDFFGQKPCTMPDSIRDINAQIEYAMRPHGISYRTVKLEKGWYGNAVGVILAEKKDGEKTALLPGNFSGYYFFDTDGKKKRLTAEREKNFKTEALLFYRPFPMKKMTVSSLLRYMLSCLTLFDFLFVVAVTLAVTLIGLFVPKINLFLFSTVLNSGSVRLLTAIAVFSVCVSVSTIILNAVKTLLIERINTKITIPVESATMMRILALPTDFFKNYNAGELSSRLEYVCTFCRMVVTAVTTTGLTSLFSLIYIAQIFSFAPNLVIPALSVILATVVLSVVTTFAQMRISKKQMEYETYDAGITYALISGIRKIRLSGAEKRAFAKWGRSYAESAQLKYNPPVLIKLSTVFSLLISSVGTVVMYWFAFRAQVSVADYLAFSTSYAMVSGAFAMLASITSTFAKFKPVLKMVKPFLESEPEVAEKKQIVENISGNIELNNITFSYEENMSPVLKNLSMKISPGQYIAVVGKTGCGKSTLIRLLLGFEKPQRGAVYYDGKDISTLDLRSLRSKLGVVTQDGKLLRGDIFSNITLSAPYLTLNEAWEAAETAGIADDIRELPMGMFTVVSEGDGGMSGGQRQRIMIARAIAPKPKVLIFDEATSALDNITQKKISQALASLKCTRIVVAHRLSTIRQCDRIVVLDDGRIVEEGTYEELIAKNGIFCELVERQRVDI